MKTDDVLISLNFILITCSGDKGAAFHFDLCQCVRRKALEDLIITLIYYCYSLDDWTDFSLSLQGPVFFL